MLFYDIVICDFFFCYNIIFSHHSEIQEMKPQYCPKRSKQKELENST